MGFAELGGSAVEGGTGNGQVLGAQEIFDRISPQGRERSTGEVNRGRPARRGRGRGRGRGGRFELVQNEFFQFLDHVLHQFRPSLGAGVLAQRPNERSLPVVFRL